MQNVSIPSSNGKQPSTPIIGTPVNTGTGTSIKVYFTASSYVGKPSTSMTYTAKAYKNSDGSYVTATSGTTSPITVTGLTANTLYKFTVYGTQTATSTNSVESDFSSALAPTVAVTTTTTTTTTAAPTTTASSTTAAPTTTASGTTTTAAPTTTVSYDCLNITTSAECNACGGLWTGGTCAF